MTVNFDNPDPHRHDKLRPEEKGACLVAERTLPSLSALGEAGSLTETLT
jgi:hypothetical protein